MYMVIIIIECRYMMVFICLMMWLLLVFLIGVFVYLGGFEWVIVDSCICDWVSLYIWFDGLMIYGVMKMDVIFFLLSYCVCGEVVFFEINDLVLVLVGFVECFFEMVLFGMVFVDVVCDWLYLVFIEVWVCVDGCVVYLVVVGVIVGVYEIGLEVGFVVYFYVIFSQFVLVVICCGVIGQWEGVGLLVLFESYVVLFVGEFIDCMEDDFGLVIFIVEIFLLKYEMQLMWFFCL